ncbi:NUDIX hydrolase [Glycomyces paridis]|uniref:NUDIX hydrolase n=1 Tax=Glycomyces paridis TaxID=2126555 RepID=A0A4S8P0J8_9ACTN|nr:NUDIX hydrolase [Glycomyces paridis]
MPVALAADVVILTIRDGRFAVLLVTRGNPPYEGRHALPGGFLEPGETIDATAARELDEETGINPALARLEQIGVYSEPGRDPRGRVVSVAYAAMVPDAAQPSAGGDAAEAHWVALDEARGTALAFDHDRILEHAVEHARRQIEHTAAAAAFCNAEFTVTELRQVYETVWRTRLDPGNFHRKIMKIPGFLEATGRTAVREAGRPATLYRADPKRPLALPFPRPRAGQGAAGR